MAIGSTVQEFAKITTIHGIAYIFDRAIKSIDKLLWFLIVCFGAGVAVYMSLDAWKTWKDAPVLTSHRCRRGTYNSEIFCNIFWSQHVV